jgi:hypothetical protein
MSQPVPALGAMLSQVFGGGKKKRRPAQYQIQWSDGSTGALVKRGSMWQFVDGIGSTYGHGRQSHAISHIESLGGKIVKGEK